MASPKLGGSPSKSKEKMPEPVSQFLQFIAGKYLGPFLVAFILGLCIWTFCMHWGVVLPVLWEWDPWRTIELSICHHFIHLWGALRLLSPTTGQLITVTYVRRCLVLSLYKAVTRDPGYVDTQILSSVAAVQMHDVNICTKCNCIKPERAHHCSQCKRCVKRMDHHCLFVNNCVGIGNYKFFVLLLLYTGLGGIINGLCVYTFMHVQTSASEGQVILVMINGVAIAVIGTMLLLFASFHFWLAAKNSTTLEFLKGDTGKYDLGSSYRNFATVFGKDLLLCLSPFHSISGKFEFSFQSHSDERHSLLASNPVDMESGGHP
mmetsp:Transcript_36755/g.57467  ORF Transcript_36755/g.57467 Transcript_36755/m.57467 type:complete len:319 (-) Transcript_36755:660-1616(-)